MQTLVNEVLYITPTYWFVFHVTKCYVVYWLARRYMGKRWGGFLILCAVVCLNYQACDIHRTRIRTIVLILVRCTLVREERMVQPPVSTKGARGCVWLFPYRVIGFWLKDLTNLARLYRYGAL